MDSIIPLLIKGTTDTLDNLEAKLWHVLLFSLNNPGNTSDLYEDQLTSFRKLEARYGDNKELLATNYAEELRSVISKYDADLNVIVDPEVRDETTYNLSITFTKGSNGVPVLSARNIIISNDNTELTVDLTNIR